MLAAFIGVVIAIVGLIVVRAWFLENALNQFYQANLIAKVDYADVLYFSPPTKSLMPYTNAESSARTTPVRACP